MHLPRALALFTTPYSGWIQQQQQQQQQYPQGIILPAARYHQLSTGAGLSTVRYLPRFTEAEKRAMDERLRQDFPGLHEEFEDDHEQPEVNDKEQLGDDPVEKELVNYFTSSSQSRRILNDRDPRRFQRQLLQDGATSVCKNLANGVTSVTRICDYTIRYPSSASTKTCSKRMDVPDDCAYRQGYNYPCSSGICKGWTCMYVELVVSGCQKDRPTITLTFILGLAPR